MDHITPLSTYRELYLSALLASDATAAAACISDASDHGIGITSLYLEVLIPALVDVGERWHRGELNVAQEHAATQITLAQMQRLRLSAPASRRTGLRAVVTSVEDETHDIGARMVADLLSLDGWEVDFLGANTPTRDLVQFVSDRAPSVVVLSVTTPECLPHAGHAIAELRLLPQSPKVLLGGLAVQGDLEQAQTFGADAIVGDAWETVQKARNLVGSTRTEESLDAILVALGERIRDLRRKRGWTQQELGDAAGLDRTYVNALERGKQNLTLGAMLRIAHALDTHLDQILFSS